MSEMEIKPVDLRGENLTGMNFSERNLKGAILTGADLTNVDFFKADLTNANFSNAILTNVDLITTNLEGANFTDAQFQGSELNNANLTNAKLINAQFQGGYLNNVNLTNAKLINAQLLNVHLINSNLTNANLEGVDLTNVNLTGANLTNANLEGADLTDVNLTGANLTGTILDLSQYGLPQRLFSMKTLVSLTNPDNLSFLLCLRDKIRNLNIKDVAGSGDGLAGIHQGLNNFTISNNGKGQLATQVLNYSRFGRHIFDFFKLTKEQFHEIKRKLEDSLSELYSFAYKDVKGKNIDEINKFCREIIETRYKLLRNLMRGGRPTRRGGKGRLKPSTQSKIKFSKKSVKMKKIEKKKN